MHTRQWIVTAGAAQARVFERDHPAQPLVLLSTLRPRARPVHRRFAPQIARHLDEACRRREYDALWLVAPTPFLDELKHALSEAVRRRLAGTVDADAVALHARQIDQRLRGASAAPSASGRLDG